MYTFDNYLFPLKTDIESGTKRREVSIVVFDVLERWLKGNGFRQLSFPRYFQRIFRTLLETGVLARQSALVLLVPIGAAQFSVSVAGILMTGVLGILHHARNVLVASLPYTLLSVNPPATGCFALGFIGRNHFAILVDWILTGMDGSTRKIFSTFMFILQLRHVEDSILLRANQERIVVGFPAIISRTIIQTVSESPSSLGYIKVKGQARIRIVGYRIAGCNGRKDSLRTVQKSAVTSEVKKSSFTFLTPTNRWPEFHSCM